MEEKKKSNKGPLLVAAILGVLLIVCVVLLVVRLTGRVEEYATAMQEQRQEEQQREAEQKEAEKKKEEKQKEAEQEESKPGKMEAKATATPEPTKAPTAAPVENSRYTLKKVPYEVILKLNEEALLVWDNDKYGMVNSQGEYLLRPSYPYVEYFDDEWVTFGDYNNMCYVYDTKGKLLYTHEYCTKGLVSEEGITYSMWTCYKKGIKTEQISAEGDEDYYGMRYYNAKTDELIFEAVGSYEDIAVGTIPDENGLAAVIKNAPYEIVIYRVTKDGYETDSYSYFDVDVRNFYWSDFINGSEMALSDGWLRTTLEESTNSMLGTETEWYQCLFDVKKGVRSYLPEKYQNAYADFYGEEKGEYYGISTLTYEQYYGEYPEEMYYAICKGGLVLTEEIYTWLNFDEKYIIAGGDGFAHIMDYDGEVLKEFVDAAYSFWNGVLVVNTGDGVYLVDENLEICSECLAEDVAFCSIGSFWKDRAGYMILEK